jgi:hypothetical protein
MGDLVRKACSVFSKHALAEESLRMACELFKRQKDKKKISVGMLITIVLVS